LIGRNPDHRTRPAVSVRGFDYRAYYGDALYDRFLALRAARHPDAILNPGVLAVAPPIGTL
jgi:hypothetical protein